MIHVDRIRPGSSSSLAIDIELELIDQKFFPSISFVYNDRSIVGQNLHFERKMDSNELMSEFLQPNFDVEAYARQLVDSSVSVAEQLSSLALGTSLLEKQLKDQISAHHEKLLLQATSIESLEDILSTLGQHVTSLQGNASRARERVDDLFRRTEIRTRQLERLHETCTILRSIIRVWQLMTRLNAAGGAKDIAKSSQYIQELRELTDEVDLRGINVVEREVTAIPKLLHDTVNLSRTSLRQGLKSQNHTMVGTALQSMLNLHCLEDQLRAVTESMIDETKQCLSNFGVATAAAGQTTNQSGGGGDDRATPGGVTLPSTVPVSVLVRANLWSDVGRFVELLTNYETQLNVLRTVAGRKRDQSSHRLLNEWIGDDFYANFWTKLSEYAIRGKLTGGGSESSASSGSESIVRQTLESEYPRFLRTMTDALRRLKESEVGDRGEVLREALKPLETAYVGKSLSRLFDSVNLAFSSSSSASAGGGGGGGNVLSGGGIGESAAAPHVNEIDAVVQAINAELNASMFDQQLFELICRNIGKVVKLFGVKCEQLLCTDGEASQVIGHPSTGQRRNVEIVNAIYYFCTQTSIVLDRLPAAPPTFIQESLSNLENLMSAAVSPLLRSIEDAVSAIIVTIHHEDFSFPIDAREKSQQQQQQCSLYMRELQEFIARVWRDYLAPFECAQFVYGLSTEVAKTTCRLFILHASLVRPLGEGGRLRLAADFAQMELAVNPLCSHLNDLDEAYVWLRSLRPFLFQSPEDVVKTVTTSGQKWHVPYSIVIQLIISQSPKELQSPHVTAGWSLTRYVEWLEDHRNELDRLQLLKGTLEAYARSVQSEGKTSYVPTYPLILELLKKGFDESSATGSGVR